MSSWIQRVSARFGARDADARGAGAETLAAAGAADLQLPFFDWLVGTGAMPDTALSAAEQRLLARLDALLASEASRGEWLPRAPGVIPQLLSSLRDQTQSADALARRVAKDAHLVAEVIRLANSAHARAIAPVNDLAQAIVRLGTEGLRRVIARVVLKPIFDAQADTLAGRSAARLWLHSEAQAAECMRLAAAGGLDPFEGYLAGLMHNVGWTAALRAIDRSEGAAPARFSRAFVQALEPRREMFFATLALPWQLTDGLTALAREWLDRGRAAPRSPLGQALLAADRHATLVLLGAAPPPASDAER